LQFQSCDGYKKLPGQLIRSYLLYVLSWSLNSKNY
jgi:hypothetical protein